ncbi:S-layer homology domain-containing protein [Candidatus Peregrinibacteria bacterium]|nr:S-layer homology domain-containing protein [Candidatus Peregrinibacteria bacterium]
METQNKFKKSVMVVLGLAAVAVIGVVAYFGATGEWFKGAIFEGVAPQSSDGTLNLYVSKDGLASSFCEKGYAADCPLKSIADALELAQKDENKNYTTANINIAAGIYAETSGTVILKDKTFNIIGQNSRINGFFGLKFINTGGSVKGLSFMDGEIPEKMLIIASYDDGSVNKLLLEDLIFTNVGFKNIIVTDGTNNKSEVTVKNVKFTKVRGYDSIIKQTKAGVHLNIENCLFDSSVGGQDAIISAIDNTRILNSLFVNSLSGNVSVIKLLFGNSSLIANNTIVNNKVLPNRAAIEIKSNYNNIAEVRNNIVIHSDILIDVEDDVRVRGNVFNSGEIRTLGKTRQDYFTGNIDIINYQCIPEFVGGAAPDGYKLKEGSTCGIDVGVDYPDGVKKDYFGTSRPIGTKYDAGFYEAPFKVQLATDIKLEATYTLPSYTAESVESVQEEPAAQDQQEQQQEPAAQQQPAKEAVGTCGQWSDLSSSHQEHFIAKKMCEDGIFKGSSDGKFYPDQILNRAEVVAIALRNAGVEPLQSDAANCFKDISTDTWYAPYVCKGKQMGVVAGFTDGTFKPGNDVTLSEALKMLMVANNKPVDTSGTPWDAKILQQAKNEDWLPYSGDISKLGSLKLPRIKAANMNWRILYWDPN